MQGALGSRGQRRRYRCGTRRRGGDCTQTMVLAEPLEDQLVDWLRDFRPDSELRSLVLARLDRLQDLYVMGDLTKSQYVMRRQALEEEVERLGRPIDPDIAKAEALQDDFAHFWTIEDAPAEPRKLLAQLFDRVWQDGGSIVAVKPRAPFARYFQTVADIQAREEIPKPRAEFRGAKGGSDGTRTRDLRRDRPAL
jgi:hypothetical protein